MKLLCQDLDVNHEPMNGYEYLDRWQDHVIQRDNPLK